MFGKKAQYDDLRMLEARVRGMEKRLTDMEIKKLNPDLDNKHCKGCGAAPYTPHADDCKKPTADVPPDYEKEKETLKESVRGLFDQATTEKAQQQIVGEYDDEISKLKPRENDHLNEQQFYHHTIKIRLFCPVLKISCKGYVCTAWDQVSNKITCSLKGFKTINLDTVGKGKKK